MLFIYFCLTNMAYAYLGFESRPRHRCFFAEHSPSSVADVKNEWSNTSNPHMSSWYCVTAASFFIVSQSNPHFTRITVMNDFEIVVLQRNLTSSLG